MCLIVLSAHRGHKNILYQLTMSDEVVHEHTIFYQGCKGLVTYLCALIRIYQHKLFVGFVVYVTNTFNTMQEHNYIRLRVKIRVNKMFFTGCVLFSH